MESSRQDLFIDMIVDWFIFKNNLITLSPCFTFLPKTGIGLPKTGVSFYCVGRQNGPWSLGGKWSSSLMIPGDIAEKRSKNFLEHSSGIEGLFSFFFSCHNGSFYSKMPAGLQAFEPPSPASEC